ncbi:MAG TPA: sigma-70 family RNA polymerase sigma factor [Acidisarcina sp.]
MAEISQTKLVPYMRGDVHRLIDCPAWRGWRSSERDIGGEMQLDDGLLQQDWSTRINLVAEDSFAGAQRLALASDELLVAAAQSGDVLAFAELTSRHTFRMRKLLYRITRNWDDTDDALQECFIKVFMKLDGFENRSKFATWLTKVAINSGLMILRKRRQQREIAIDGGDDEGKSGDSWVMRDRTEDPETYAARRESEERLRQAILQLPPIYRAVVELRERQECSMKELSERLGISLPAAKSRLSRARKALRSSLCSSNTTPPS